MLQIATPVHAKRHTARSAPPTCANSAACEPEPKRDIAPLVVVVVVLGAAELVPEPECDPELEAEPDGSVEATVGAVGVTSGAEVVAVEATGVAALGEDAETIESVVVAVETVELPPLAMPTLVLVVVAAPEEAEPPVMVNMGEMLPESPRTRII